MNSKQNKKFFKLNIVDVALIIIAFIAVATLIFFFSQNDIKATDKGENVTVEYALEFSPIRNEFKRLIIAGDSLTDVATSKDLGEVIEPMETNTSTLTVIVRAEAVRYKGEYRINGVRLILGNEMEVRVPGFTGTAVLRSINVIEG